MPVIFCPPLEEWLFSLRAVQLYLRGERRKIKKSETIKDQTKEESAIRELITTRYTPTKEKQKQQKPRFHLSYVFWTEILTPFKGTTLCVWFVVVVVVIVLLPHFTMAEVAWHKGDRVEYEGKIYFCRPNGTSVYLFNTLEDLQGPKEAWLQKKKGSPRKTSVTRILTKETPHKEKKTVRILHSKIDKHYCL